MPIPSSISDLSETASSNSPSGSETVGPQANEYLQAAFAFIKQLADGWVKADGSVAMTGPLTLSANPVSALQPVTKQYGDSTYQGALGYTPVQQGTGIGQAGNVVRIGWSAAGRLKTTVDNVDIGNVVFDSNLNSAVNTINGALNGKQPVGDYATNSALNATNANLSANYAPNSYVNSTFATIATAQNLQNQINTKQPGGAYVRDTNSQTLSMTWDQGQGRINFFSSSTLIGFVTLAH